MIYEKIQHADNYWTEGFDVSVVGLEVEVEEGKIIEEFSTPNEEGVMELSQRSMTYPEFAFDVVADAEFEVVYDVYLLELPSASGDEVSIQRTILADGVYAFYEGEDTLRYTLMSLIVPVEAVDLNDARVSVMKVVRS